MRLVVANHDDNKPNYTIRQRDQTRRYQSKERKTQTAL